MVYKNTDGNAAWKVSVLIVSEKQLLYIDDISHMASVGHNELSLKNNDL